MSIDTSMPTEFAARVDENQRKLAAQLRRSYDFIVCGSGSSGSVIARRLVENPDVHVLLLEAGGNDDVASVWDPLQWQTNLGSERDWGFVTQPSPHLNGRTIALNAGKVLGGGSSINVMMWARGHKNDWDFFAAESGDPAWSYESVLGIYRRIEDWHGTPDPQYRGSAGPLFVQQPQDPHPLAAAMVQAAHSVGVPSFPHQNGRMMEGEGGASLADLRIRDGRRQTIFRSYTYPYMDRPNLTVLTGALVTRVILDGAKATGVEFLHDSKVQRVGASSEVVVSLGALHTPKVLMLSGIGDESELRRLGIPCVQHLPGVGRNLQDHIAVCSIWESPEVLTRRNNGAEATYFWKSDPRLDAPDLQTILGEAPLCSPEAASQFDIPAAAWTMLAGIVRPESRGRIRLTSNNPQDPIQIDANALSDPSDVRAAIAAVQLSREIAAAWALRPFVTREVMPGKMNLRALEDFVRDGAVTLWHPTCTAKMGRDEMSVVGADLRIHGVTNLRIADGSIMPRVTTGNTMAPCVVIGERGGDLLKHDWHL